MSEKEKGSIKAVVEAVKELGEDIPKETKQYLMGYAECLAGMAERRQQEAAQASA